MTASGVLGVLVVHATGSRVADVLRTLGEQTHEDMEVVVAAIGEAPMPTGGPGAERIRSVVRVPDGAGYPEAVHRALNEVEWTDARYLLLLHDDVALDPRAVELLVERADADDAAIVGAKLVEWDDPAVLQEVGGAIDRLAVRRSALDGHELDHGQHDGTTDVLYCSDACLLVRTDAFYELDGLDREAWPVYADVDLCWRARASGKRVEVQPEARVRHAATLSRGGRDLDRLDLLEATERGRLRFMLRHYALLGLAVVLPQVLAAAVFRVLAAALRREFWIVRATVGAWARTVRGLPSFISARRRAPPSQVDDQELMRLGARTVVLELRGERAEWFSRAFEQIGRIVRAALGLMREPVSWVAVLAALALALIGRDVLIGGTFLLGELRPLPTFTAALGDMFSTVRREGLDPFAPAGPGMVVLGLVRSLSFGAALGQKLALVLPLVAAAAAGARLADVLELGRAARRWLAAAAAANPVTFLLLRDGELGALVTWTASLWLVSALALPTVAQSFGEHVRFRARWALGFAVVAALHPPGLVWLAALGVTLLVSRHGDGRSAVRLEALGVGVLGAVVLCFPWSFEWFTARTPLVGASTWLVAGELNGVGAASLGAGWPLLLWLGIALAATYFVGLTRATMGLVALAAGALVLGAGGAMPAATMLVGVGICALLLVVVVARRIYDELPRYELGLRQAVVVGGVVALAVIWSASAVLGIASGTRSPSLPQHTAVSERIGRVLWLSETTGGVRSWTTLNFRHQLESFPPPSGPVENMVSEALEAARGGRTHRLGSVLSLADVSHVVILDRRSGRGLDAQADLTPVETEGATVVYQNDAWHGAALRLAEAPRAPLTASGIAGITRTPEPVAVSNWPFGPLTLQAAEADEGVVYVHGGPRGGWSVPGLRATRAAAGFYVEAAELSEAVEIRPSGWWRVFVPLQVGLAASAVLAWLVAAYLARPPATAPPRRSLDLHPSSLRAVVAAVPVVVLLGGLLLGWTGVARAASGPFLSSAWYCPPVGEGFGQRIAIVNPTASDVTYQVRPSLVAVPEAEGLVAARSRETVTVEPTQGAVVESFGQRLAVGAEVERLGDADATLCASSPRATHLFPEGGRAATRARPRLFERYIIYNPFAELARASVRFLSPDESIAPPALRDVQVPAGEFVVVDPEEQFEPMLDLSTVVTVWQGRAVVARRLRTEEQTSWSLSSELREGGVLPRAVTQDAVTAVIALNPGEEAATVSVFGAGEQGSLAGERFIVPQQTRTSFDVNVLAPDAGGLLVRLTSDRPVAIESLVAPIGREAVSLLPPLIPSQRWVLPIGEERELVIVNPNPRSVRFTLRRLGPGPALGSFTVEANRVETVPLPGRAPFGVLVSAQGPVTAAAVGPRGSLPGVPVTGR